MSKTYSFLLKIRPTIIAVALKKILGIKRIVVNTGYGDFYVDPVSNFGNALFTTKEYEPYMIKTFKENLSAGESFIDIGANEGFFSIVASDIVGPTGRVFTVEPQERLQEVIEKNVELNRLKNVQIIKKAISDTKGETEIVLAPDTNTGSSGFTNPQKYYSPRQKVEMDTLENIFNDMGIDTIDFAKVDVEGFEYETILGSKQLFKDHRIKRIALELHPWVLGPRGLDGDDIVNFLKECGYKASNQYDNLVLSYG
ncbi:MAG: FkbM family methyltransferase [Cyanothece sp. SIO1E1]|nr:FkbM family methyltransferase [Cyanothece sp. SIO1E1]